MRLGIFLAANLLSLSTIRADFLPENDLWKEDGLLRNSSMTNATFNQVVDEVEMPYRKIVQALGSELRIFRLWSDPTVNAGSAQDDNYWKIWLYGGLARRPEMTRDAYALVVCHELGHHLAGYPFSPYVMGEGMSDEGQADYFSTLVCPRVIWKDQLTTNAKFAETLGPIPKAKCDLAWANTNDRNLCYRVMKASESLAGVDASLSNIAISWSTPDPLVVMTTNHSYPSGQCRLDTYAAGATCVKTWNSSIIPAKSLADRDTVEAEGISRPYTCNRPSGDPFGFRPLCWFKPYL